MNKIIAISFLFFILIFVAFVNKAYANEYELPKWRCEDNSPVFEFRDIELINLGNGYDTKWRPLDTIKIIAEVENEEVSGDTPQLDVENIVAEIGFFSPYKNGSNIVRDLHFINPEGKQIELGTIESGGETKFAIFEFLVPQDLEPTIPPNKSLWNEGQFQLSIKITGTDSSGNQLCTYDGAFGSGIEIEHNSYGDRIFQLEQKILELETKTKAIERKLNVLQRAIDKIMRLIDGLPKRSIR